MAITDTKQAKDFTAGAPDIKLKGDLTPTKIASEPDMMDERNELSLRLFNKDLRLLTPEEMDILNEEAERLMQKFSMSDDNYEAEFMRLVGEFMERGLNQQEAIDAARDELERLRSKFMADGGRAQYGLGSLVKSVKKAVKKVAKSPIGKAALLYTGVGALGNLAAGSGLAGMFSGFTNPATFLGGASNIFKKGALTNILNLSGAEKGVGAAMDAFKIGGTGAIITGLLAAKERQPNESDMDFAQRTAQVNDQLDVQFRRLYPQGGNESDEDYDVRIKALVEGADDQTVPVGEMAEGGRVMRAFGSDELVEKASGIEGLPINVNSKGVKELDLRETGGFIPPVGVKEKADDIPAMLSNNEFVFTADAVRAAGGGSVNKGAQRMYDLMKNLESKVV